MNKLFSKLAATVIIAALLIYAAPMIMPAVKAQPPVPSFYVTPDTETFTPHTASVGTLFNVTVWAAAPNGTDSWGIQLGFNASLLQAVTAGFTNVGTSMLFKGHSTTPLGPIIDNSGTSTGGNGSVEISETLLGQDYIAANTASVCYVTFNITAAPAINQALTSFIDPGFGLPPVGETLFILQAPSPTYPTGEIDYPNTAYCTYSFSNIVGKASVTFAQTGLDSSASGTVLTINGTALTYSQLPNITSVNSGDTLLFSYQTDVSSTSSGEQFALTSVNETSPLTVSTSETITGSYVTQYQVSFAVNASGTGTTTPSGTNVWEDAGSLPISATPNPGYTFSNWTTNTGNITVASPSLASTTANVTGPGTITANFVSGKGLYDIIGDGLIDKVDIKDIHVAALAFGSRPGYPNWNPRADVGGFGEVNIVDIAMIAKHYGQLD